MSDPLTDRLNKILPRLVSDDFLSGSGIGNEIALYRFKTTRMVSDLQVHEISYAAW